MTPLYFKDRITDSLHGQNQLFFDALDSAGAVKLPDFKLALKNSIQAGNEGTPLNAANMNYASGVADLPVPANVTIGRGQLLTLNGGWAVPANGPVRAQYTSNASVVGMPYYLISDTGTVQQYLMAGVAGVGASAVATMWVTTVDWTAHTVTFGAEFTLQPEYISYRFELISPTLACMVFGNGYGSVALGGTTARFFTISGTIITGSSYGGNTDVGYGVPNATRPVKCGTDGVLLATISAATAGVCTMRLIRYAGTGMGTSYVSAAVGGITDYSQLLSLVSCDGGNSNYLLFYSSAAGGAGTLYARKITVSGNTVTVDANPAALPAGSICTQGYNGGGMPVTYNNDGKFLFSTVHQAGTMMTLQTAAIDANGAATFGAKLAVPVVAGTADGNGYGSVTQPITRWQPSTFVTKRGDGSYYIAGLGYLPPFRHKFAEVGADLSSVAEYLPFKVVNINDPIQGYVTRQLAIENKNNPGEFVFAENASATGSAISAQSWWFGRKYDSPVSGNIIGVALDAQQNGFVKAQTAQKLLPGIGSVFGVGPVVAGRLYIPGTNGALAPYSGTGTPIAMAVGQTDMLFGGAILQI